MNDELMNDDDFKNKRLYCLVSTLDQIYDIVRKTLNY